MTQQEAYWFWLCNIENIWNGKICRLLQVFQTPEAVFYAKEKELAKVKGLKASDIDAIVKNRDLHLLEEKFEYLREKSIYFISRESVYYPDQFRQISDGPYGFYARGNRELLRQTEQLPVFSIVGARNTSVQGKTLAKRFGETLGYRGAIVVSGMARGIDSMAHTGALDGGGSTIAVLGCGVDVCYPRENQKLYDALIERGLILSEYPCKTPPNSWQFPLRNRLISALSDGIVVIEAKRKSGSLITVSYGLEQGKDIYAVPGRPGDIMSEGCNQLIKQGAGLITEAEELLELSIPGKRFLKGETEENKKKILLEKELEMVYSSVDLVPKEIHVLLEESGVDPGSLPGLLVRLQMMDLIEEPIRNYYTRKHCDS